MANATAQRPSQADVYDPHRWSLPLVSSAEAKARDHRVGAARQHNCRLGQVDLCQVGVALSYSHNGHWMMVDAELYLPQEWFDPEHRGRWQRLHVPAERVFLT